METLLHYLRRDDPDRISTRDVLNFVIMDSVDDSYPGKLDGRKLKDMGVEVARSGLSVSGPSPLLDENRLIPVLLSLT